MELAYLNNKIAILKISSEEEPHISIRLFEHVDKITNEINNAKELKVIVLQGTKKYFSLGAQREELLYSIQKKELGGYIPKLIGLLSSIQVPLISAMQGHAIGGGLAIGLWCDMAIWAQESLYGMNFMALGFTPGMGSTILLEDAIGSSLAYEMLYTGKLVKGHELKAAGVPFAHMILAQKEVLDYAYQLASEIAQHPRDAIYLLKKTLMTKRMSYYEKYLQQEREMHSDILSSQLVLNRIQENYVAKNNIKIEA